MDRSPIDLAPMATVGRIGRVTDQLGAAGCDALLVSDLLNIRYLTGFTGSAARLVLGPGELAVLVTDGRYEDQAAQELASAGVAARVAVGRSQQAQRDVLEGVLGGVPRIGLEAAHVSWADQQGYAQLFSGSELVPTVGLVEERRVVKDDGELARLQRAADIAGEALAHVFGLLDQEPTEAEFALALDSEMRRLGASGPSFETIVAGGPNAGLPHHRPDGRRIREGDLLVLDFGATVDGYHSDMTRTAMLGDPSADQAELLALVTEAQARGVAAVRDGVAASDVDAVCRSFIAAAGWGERFTHGTGHGVGLRIHEAPWVNATSTDTLVTGAVVTVEPGVYRGPLGGVRVEDSLVVLADGSRSLTTTPKDLSCLRSPPTSSRTG
jgi:Xaa-Pro aminopeptidase